MFFRSNSLNFESNAKMAFHKLCQFSTTARECSKNIRLTSGESSVNSPDMRKSKLNLKVIYSITKTFIKEKPQNLRGRPRIYPEAFIISLFLYQTIRNLSYREVLEEAQHVFGQSPSLFTYYYRVSKLPKTLLKIILHKLAYRLLHKGESFKFLISDGTGFSYNEVYPLKFLRGLEIRRVKSHIRVVPIVGVTASGRRIIITAEAGGPYASEVKLLVNALKEADRNMLKAQSFIADRCYDSIEVMEQLVELGIRPAIKVKETFRKGIKHPLRKESAKLWEEIGVNRYLIESLFGTLKQTIGSHFRVRKEDIAQKRGLAVFVLYNMYLLITMLYFLLVKCQAVTVVRRKP